MKTISSWMVVAVLLALGGVAQAAGWEDPATLSGLVGSYAGPPGGKVLFVTFGGTDGFRASGPFTRFVVTGRYNAITIQSGQYQAIAQNPAIGAIISFTDGAGKDIDSWPMIAIQRDPTRKKITGLKVVTPDGTILELFRVGL